jgi:aerobic carbon-monoxide dehydrogenase small subunit
MMPAAAMRMNNTADPQRLYIICGQPLQAAAAGEPGRNRESARGSRNEAVSDLHAIRVTVNGTRYERAVEPRLLLADFLRHTLGLTGTHVGCEHGVCGACTILLDGHSARSCLLFAVQVDACEVVTVEGLGTAGELCPLQQAFREHHALQCGFCTPGMLMTCIDMLRKYPLATDDEIREALSGNLCRCTGYDHIVKAVAAARTRLRNSRQPGERR